MSDSATETHCLVRLEHSIKAIRLGNFLSNRKLLSVYQQLFLFISVFPLQSFWSGGPEA